MDWTAPRRSAAGHPDTPDPAADISIERTAAPLYRDVATALERAVQGGVWKAGEQIPTEAELERRFAASRGTIRMAINELVRRGWLHRQAGRGTFVLGPSFNSLERYFRYEPLAGGAAMAVRNTILGQGVRKARADTAAALGLSAGEPVAWLRRLRHHRDEPFLLIDSFFPMEVWKVVGAADLTVHPLYDLFKDRFGLYVVSADEFLRADLARAAEAASLGIAARSAVIRLERTARTFGDRPVEHRRAVGRADRFRYHVRLT